MPNLREVKAGELLNLTHSFYWVIGVVHFSLSFFLRRRLETLQVRVNNFAGAGVDSFDIILVINLYPATLLCFVANFLSGLIYS